MFLSKILKGNPITIKEKATKAIDILPDEADMDDTMYALYIKVKFEHGYQEIEQGKGIPHEEVERKLFAKYDPS